MAPMPSIMSTNMPSASNPGQPLRLHSIREYLPVEAIAPVAPKRAVMPKPISTASRASMPAIPKSAKADQLNAPIPDEAFEEKCSYDEEDDDDDNCATKIQSREEILRDIAAAAAAAGLTSAGESALPSTDAPRLVKNEADDAEGDVPRPSTDLLLTAPPTSAEESEVDALLGDDDFDDDDMGPKTSLENIVPEGFFEQAESASQACAEQVALDNAPGSFPISVKPAGANTYVAPKEVIKPPSKDDDDDFFL